MDAKIKVYILFNLFINVMKSIAILGIFAVVFLVSGCMDGGSITGGAIIANEDVVKSGDVVQVDYWLTVDGKQIDTSEGRGPFEFSVDTGQVIPGFDKAVTGMKVGETKEVVLSGNDAYTSGPLAGKELNFKVTLLAIQ